MDPFLFVNTDYSNYYPQQQNRFGESGNRNDQYRPGYNSYDRTDNRQNDQDYRGNGYDNRDPMYYNSNRGTGYSGGSSGVGAGGYNNRDSGYESGSGGYHDGNYFLFAILASETIWNCIFISFRIQIDYRTVDTVAAPAATVAALAVLDMVPPIII